jgi:hypothetical protein
MNCERRGINNVFVLAPQRELLATGELDERDGWIHRAPESRHTRHRMPRAFGKRGLLFQDIFRKVLSSFLQADWLHMLPRGESLFEEGRSSDTSWPTSCPSSLPELRVSLSTIIATSSARCGGEVRRLSLAGRLLPSPLPTMEPGTCDALSRWRNNLLFHPSTLTSSGYRIDELLPQRPPSDPTTPLAPSSSQSRLHSIRLKNNLINLILLEVRERTKSPLIDLRQDYIHEALEFLLIPHQCF